MVIKRLISWMKINCKKIVVFILLISFGFFFHFYIFLSGSIVYLTFFSAFAFLIFSFSIFKAFYRKFFFFISVLIFIQSLILFIPFPKCDSNFKLPQYGCECAGIEKQIFGGSQCIGKVKKCYNYFKNPNIEKEQFWKLYNEDRYHQELEVSCNGFPEK